MDKEYLLTQAISSLITTGTQQFTAEQLLTVADISVEELNKIKTIYGSKVDEIVRYFGNKTESRCAVNGN